MSWNDPPLQEFRLRHNFPFQLGVYLGTNAIADATLLVDGPDCAFLKAQHIWGRHDLSSTLLRPDGDHRVVFSGADGRRAGRLSELLAELVTRTQVGVVLATSLPATTQAGGPGAALADLARESPERPWIHVPGGSLDDDWLTGYATLLDALATELPLDEGPRDARDVGIVGLQYERNEADHGANVAELSRLITGVGLRPVSVWLSGAGCGALAAIGRAGTLISLPAGRAAARRLQRRTGATLVELDLPVGLDPTARWLRALGRALGTDALAEGFIERELAATIPHLSRVVGRHLLGRRFYLGLDPFQACGLAQLLEELGGEVLGGCLPAVPAHADALRDRGPLLRDEFLFQPREHTIAEIARDLDADLVISNAALARLLPGPSLELGFPTVRRHALVDQPMVGFRGVMHLVQQILDALQWRPRDAGR